MHNPYKGAKAEEILLRQGALEEFGGIGKDRATSLAAKIDIRTTAQATARDIVGAHQKEVRRRRVEANESAVGSEESVGLPTAVEYMIVAYLERVLGNIMHR